MILRDPVHGLVAFEGLAEEVIGRLLAAIEVQRLRGIRQLGFTSLVFPGAEHSRFSHALGAAHVMVRYLDRIKATQAILPAAERLDEEAEADALAAALLHDLGHGAFSHLSEEVLPLGRPHEAWTVDAILDPGGEVHGILSALSPGMPQRVAMLVRGQHRLGYLARAVSGTIDVDRCDYLLRDSHMTGVSYGVYDLDWLLRALTPAQAPSGEWVMAIEGRKGLPPIEGFFLARQFMYQQVYHHKATRAAEAIIRAIFTRTAELVQEGTPPHGTPPALIDAIEGRQVPVRDYLGLDDLCLMSAFRAWEQSTDATLAELTARLSRRILPKTVPLPVGGDKDGRWALALREARRIVHSHGQRADLSVWVDNPSDVPFAEPEDDSADGLWVTLRHQPVQRLGSISFLLGELRNKRIERPRLVFPADFRMEVEGALAKQGLGGPPPAHSAD